jgi:hypothetical protein
MTIMFLIGSLIINNLVESHQVLALARDRLKRSLLQLLGSEERATKSRLRAILLGHLLRAPLLDSMLARLIRLSTQAKKVMSQTLKFRMRSQKWATHTTLAMMSSLLGVYR